MNRLLGAYTWGAILLWGVHLATSDTAFAADPSAKLQRYEATQVEMGVPFKILLYAADKVTAKGAFDAAWTRIAELNAILSDYDPQSELSHLTATAPAKTGFPVSSELWIVLERSQAMADQSGGAFDVTVGPYIRLWRRARRQREMPSPERMAEARAAVGYRHLVLDAKHRTAQLMVPGMRLDLGGIAMGYVVDEAMRVLREHGITRALIDASGDILASDPPPGKAGWTIAVIPLSEKGTPTREVLLSQAAISTAGDAFQHVVIEGRRYSHIVDPHTGLGLSQTSGVTVIAKDCFTADALDTTVNVLGPEAGLKLVEATPNAAAFIVLDNQGTIETFETKNFRQYEAPSQNRPK